MTDLVSSLANQIISLINSKPSSPTKEEIEAVLRDALTGVTSHDDDPMTREPFMWSEPIDPELSRIAAEIIEAIEQNNMDAVSSAQLFGSSFTKITYKDGVITSTLVPREDAIKSIEEMTQDCERLLKARPTMPYKDVSADVMLLKEAVVRQVSSDSDDALVPWRKDFRTPADDRCPSSADGKHDWSVASLPNPHCYCTACGLTTP